MLIDLGFSSAVLDRMSNTRALDGTLEAEGKNCNVTWTTTLMTACRGFRGRRTELTILRFVEALRCRGRRRRGPPRSEPAFGATQFRVLGRIEETPPPNYLPGDRPCLGSESHVCTRIVRTRNRELSSFNCRC